MAFRMAFWILDQITLKRGSATLRAFGRWGETRCRPEQAAGYPYAFIPLMTVRKRSAGEMPIQRESMQVGQCYSTASMQVRRVMRILPDGRVQYEARGGAVARTFNWRTPKRLHLNGLYSSEGAAILFSILGKSS